MAAVNVVEPGDESSDLPGAVVRYLDGEPDAEKRRQVLAELRRIIEEDERR